MFCTHCGTVNPDDARACVKCGKSCTELHEPQPATPVDVTLASRPRTVARDRSQRWTWRLLVLSLAAILAIMTPMVLMIRQMVAGSPVVRPAATGSATETLAPMALANDAARKANARRLQMAVAQYYSQNDRYPATLAEIPQEMLGFVPDPQIYHYFVTQQPYGYRIEVTMQSSNVSGEGQVTEGGVTKYIINGQ